MSPNARTFFTDVLIARHHVRCSVKQNSYTRHDERVTAMQQTLVAHRRCQFTHRFVSTGNGKTTLPESKLQHASRGLRETSKMFRQGIQNITWTRSSFQKTCGILEKAKDDRQLAMIENKEFWSLRVFIRGLNNSGTFPSARR